MQLKDWAYLGNYEFYTEKLKLLAMQELAPEKWSYAGNNDFGILRSYIYFTFENCGKKEIACLLKRKNRKLFM